MYRPFIRPNIKIPKPKIEISREEIDDYNNRLMYGRGILQKLKGHVKKFGTSVISAIQKHIKPNFLVAYQKVANHLRKSIKGARPLEVGELHPWGYNYMGPGTNIKKYRNVRPINALDNVARTHDIEYEEAKNAPNTESLIHDADIKMVNSITPEMEKLPYGKVAKKLMLAKYASEQLASAISGEPKTFYG